MVNPALKLSRRQERGNDEYHMDADDKEISLLGVDVSEAFHQVPLNGDEGPFTAAMFQNKLYIFKVLVFG